MCQLYLLSSSVQPSVIRVVLVPDTKQPIHATPGREKAFRLPVHVYRLIIPFSYVINTLAQLAGLP